MNTNSKTKKTRLHLQKTHSSRNFFSSIPFAIGTSRFFISSIWQTIFRLTAAAETITTVSVMLVPWMPETFHAQSNMTEMLLFGFSLTFQVKNRKYKCGRQALRWTANTKHILVLTKLLRVHINKKPNHWLFNFSTTYFWNYNIATTWLSLTLVNSPVVFNFFLQLIINTTNNSRAFHRVHCTFTLLAWFATASRF